jgi:cytochrome bd-type quinol oxidase subunit 2
MQPLADKMSLMIFHLADATAAPHVSLAFMFWGAGLFVFPLVLFNTRVSYIVFRGKP